MARFKVEDKVGWRKIADPTSFASMDLNQGTMLIRPIIPFDRLRKDSAAAQQGLMGLRETFEIVGPMGGQVIDLEITAFFLMGELRIRARTKPDVGGSSYIALPGEADQLPHLLNGFVKKVYEWRNKRASVNQDQVFEYLNPEPPNLVREVIRSSSSYPPSWGGFS